MDIRVLGSLGAYADGSDLALTSPSQRTVRAVLAAHPDHYVRADTLIDALWGSDPPPSAERTPRSYVSGLRSALGQCVVAGRSGYCCAPLKFVSTRRTSSNGWPRPKCLD